jgi:L-ascorbate metabolism protein UlaG (beta-lactamase superfamily)
VLVTHAHFDHLDRRTLRKVAADQPIVVPHGVGNLVHDLGFNIVHELDHWQRVELGPLCVSLTPCHHWGARMLHDQHRGFGGLRDRSGWPLGLSLRRHGLLRRLQEIGKRFNIEVALLPIGAYDPPSGREVHMNPEQAVQAFTELGAKTLVPMHYGSFRLGTSRSMNRQRACSPARASTAWRRACLS